MSKAGVLVGILSLAGGVSASAAVAYSSIGSSYAQNFDGLAASGTTNSWVNDSTLTGWHATQSTGTTFTGYTQYQAYDGIASNQGVLLSLGTGTGTDRGLGGQNLSVATTTSTSMYYGLQLVNATGVTLGGFTLNYFGEQWRVVQNEVRDGMVLQYQIFSAGTGSLSASTGWNATSLGFAAPRVISTASTFLDGNDALNRVAAGGTVSGISWTDGSELWLRWVDSSTGINAAQGGTRSALALDDLTFSADVIPEPSGSLLSGLGAGLLAVRRRVR